MMKMTLRRALMLALLTLPLVMVALLGYLSYSNALRIVDTLGEEIIEQTSGRIRSTARNLLQQAATLSDANAAYIQRVRPGHELLARDFRRQLLQFENFAYLSFTATNGDYVHVKRESDGDFVRMEITSAGKTYSDWTSTGWQTRGAAEATNDDQRQRPYYQQAIDAGQQTWTSVYLFGSHPEPRYPGLTCATPVYDAQGALIGVLTVDFALSMLGDFLGSMDVFTSGSAFIIDEDQVIAHPDTAQLLEINGPENIRLLLEHEVPDPVLRDYLRVASHSKDSAKRYEWSTNEVRYLGFQAPLSDRGSLGWSLAIIVPRDELTGAVERDTQVIGLIAVASLIALIIVGLILAQAIARPLRRLTTDVERIGQFELDASPMPETWLWEVERLAHATEEMKTGLRSFGKFVPIELVRKVLTSGTEARLGGDERELTIFFSDIQGFTEIAEALPPAELVELLGEYLGEMTDEIARCEGTLDKYIGDAVMAFWGAPVADASHAANACRAALGNLARLDTLRRRWAASGRPDMSIRIGINTGPLVVGNIGSENRLNYTVIGDSVNLAARLEGLNKYYGTAILLSDATAVAAGPEFLTRPLERVAVKGKSEGVLVHELLALRTEADEATQELANVAAEALSQFEQRNFEEARRAYERLLELRPQDPAASRGIQDCDDLIANPPAPDWDGIRHMDSK